jgi:mxaJ protein
VCAGERNLPYSNREGEGFENRIAEIVAAELGAELAYHWLEQPEPRARTMSLERGDCDLLVGAVDGGDGILTTIAYYRSTYVFLHRRDAPFEVTSLDDPVLRGVRIGVQAGMNGLSAVSYALANRGLIDMQVTYLVDYGEPDPLSALVDAVAAGEVDVAIVWGPVAGYYAAIKDVDLELVPVLPQIEVPFVPLVVSVSMGVRAEDESLRDSLNLALQRRWDEIQRVLGEYGVPLEPLPRPAAGPG